MKKLLHIIILFISSLAFGQNSIKVYDNILKEVKCSKAFQEFLTYEEVEYKNFKITSYLFNFCEFYGDLIDCDIDIPKNYCTDYVSIFDEGYDGNNEEVLIIKDNKKLSRKGRKTQFVHFSKTVNNYIAVSVFNQKKVFGDCSHLLYLFRVKELDNVELLYADAIIIDR